MISLLGRTAILVALAACSIGTVTGVVAGMRRSATALRWTQWMALVFGAATTFAFALMEYALFTDDFSVSYVAEVGSSQTPDWVTFVSLWSSLNGSILLWAFVLGAFVVGLVYSTRNRFPDHTPWALATALGVGVFFTFLVAGVANPFESVSPVPTEGPGPNPLLQNHILMVIHPPALYLGYVGMTVPFAMGAAALLAGKLDAAWVLLMRRWMLLPWGFLTVGIVLGGWWSYEVLGWGGWWAWDPVENASFMPWLTAAAFLHSAMVMERKDQLRGWTISLLLATFLLTILGTFMTRSGVFNSVHSFTQSPIGPAFLTFLGLALAFSVVLLAARVDKLSPAKEGLVGPASREVGFLVNNLLFAALTFTVLIGTVYPLLNEWVTDTQISVGQPYFDRMAAPLGVAIVFMMGVGPVLPWGRSDEVGAMKRLAMPFVAALVAVAIGAGFGMRSAWVLVGYGVSGFALAVTLREMVAPILARTRARKDSVPAATLHMLTYGRRRFGGYIVHIGVIMIAVAHATATSSTERYSVTVPVGQATALGDYVMTFTGSEWVEQPHRKSLVATFTVERNGKDLGTISPKLNHYARMGSPIGTPEVRSGLDEDLYVSLINVDEAANVASIQVLVEPLVWWLWFGGGVMMVGTMIGAWPSRRRRDSEPGSAAGSAVAGSAEASA
jgi:cytochrome c-type biogenesis protein CcmF